MKLWIAKESHIERYFQDKPEFFSKEVEFDDDLAKRIMEFEEKVRTYRTWIRAVEAAIAGRTPEGVSNALKEKPEWLEEAPKEEPLKERATAQRSSKQSPAKRKKTAKKSGTSRKKAE